MNTYEIDIWCSVYHNEEFSHTSTRLEFVHALNEERAKKKIRLAPERKWKGSQLEIKASPETIYSIRKTGTVVIKRCYIYSDGRYPKIIKN